MPCWLWAVSCPEQCRKFSGILQTHHPSNCLPKPRAVQDLSPQSSQGSPQQHPRTNPWGHIFPSQFLSKAHGSCPRDTGRAGEQERTGKTLQQAVNNQEIQRIGQISLCRIHWPPAPPREGKGCGQHIIPREYSREKCTLSSFPLPHWGCEGKKLQSPKQGENFILSFA